MSPNSVPRLIDIVAAANASADHSHHRPGAPSSARTRAHSASSMNSAYGALSMTMHHHTPTSNVKALSAGTRKASRAASCEPVRWSTSRHTSTRITTCISSAHTISAVHEPGHPACSSHCAIIPQGWTWP